MTQNQNPSPNATAAPTTAAASRPTPTASTATAPVRAAFAAPCALEFARVDVCVTTATDAGLVWKPESDVVGTVSVVGRVLASVLEGVAVTVTLRMDVSVCECERVLASFWGSGSGLTNGGRGGRAETEWDRGGREQRTEHRRLNGTHTETDALADAESVSPACELGAGESAAVVLCAADVVGTLLAEVVSADDAALLDPDADDEAEEVAPELVDDDDDDREESVEEEELAVPMLDAVAMGTALCGRASDYCTRRDRGGTVRTRSLPTGSPTAPYACADGYRYR